MAGGHVDAIHVGDRPDERASVDRLRPGADAGTDDGGPGQGRHESRAVRHQPRGEIVRIGKPSELTASATVQIRYVRLGEEVVLETDEPTRALHELTARALAEGFELEELEIRRATLEDVYLDLVAEDEP